MNTAMKPRRVVARMLGALTRRPQRRVALPLAGMAVGLLVAGAGLFHRPAVKLSVVPAGYVALVNQKGILLSDFITQAAAETGEDFAATTPAERSRVLREMIDEELQVQRALVLDLPETTTEVRGTMVSAVESQVAAPLLAIPPTDAQLRAFYESRRAKYTSGGSMLVHDLILRIGGYQNADQSTAQAEADASEAVYQLRAGASLDYVKEHFGLADSGRMDNTEQLDFAAKIHLGDRLYAVAQTLGDGEVSEPQVEADGVHILVMDKRLLPKVADFSTLRQQVYNEERLAVIQRAAQENVNYLRSQAEIIVAPGMSE